MSSVRYDAKDVERFLEAIEQIAEAQERQARAKEMHAGAVASLAHEELPGSYNPETLVDDFAMYVRLFEEAGRL